MFYLLTEIERMGEFILQPLNLPIKPCLVQFEYFIGSDAILFHS